MALPSLAAKSEPVDGGKATAGRLLSEGRRPERKIQGAAPAPGRQESRLGLLLLLLLLLRGLEKCEGRGKENMNGCSFRTGG